MSYKHLLNKILNIGIEKDREISDYLADKIYLSNALAILLEILGISYCILSYFLAPKAILLPFFGGIISGLLIFLLNHYGKYNLSRILASTAPSCLASIYFAFILQQGETRSGAMFFVIVCFTMFTFLVVDTREKQLLIPLMFYVVAIISLQQYFDLWIDVKMSSKYFHHPIMVFTLYVTAFGMMFYCLLFLLQNNYNSEKSNTNLIKELQLQRTEIATQNEELFQQQEELQAQRDYIERNNNELKNTNNRLINNEKVLRKVFLNFNKNILIYTLIYLFIK